MSTIHLMQNQYNMYQWSLKNFKQKNILTNFKTHNKFTSTDNKLKHLNIFS